MTVLGLSENSKANIVSSKLTSNKNNSRAVHTALYSLDGLPVCPHLRLLGAINTPVSRARMSTLFALVKTHNYLIYISFPQQNRKPLCTPTLSVAASVWRRWLESWSNQLLGCRLEREKLPLVRIGRLDTHWWGLRQEVEVNDTSYSVGSHQRDQTYSRDTCF